ncbi:MAG: sigma-70 family RNA polymerase sigma factor [Desulfosarcinaceae bacterium]
MGYMQADPDIELMLRFKAGDQGAFRRLFDRHKGPMIQFCYRFCGHSGVAEELAQETFLRVYRAAARYRPKARFRTWLYRIATNVCLNEIRRPDYRNRIETLEASDANQAAISSDAAASAGEDRPDVRLALEEQQQMVFKAIAQLPEDQRAALLLRVEQDFSYKEIGRQIGRTENHVKTLIHRGRCKLKQLLAAYFGEEP